MVLRVDGSRGRKAAGFFLREGRWCRNGALIFRSLLRFRHGGPRCKTVMWGRVLEISAVYARCWYVGLELRDVQNLPGWNISTCACRKRPVGHCGSCINRTPRGLLCTAFFVPLDLEGNRSTESSCWPSTGISTVAREFAAKLDVFSRGPVPCGRWCGFSPGESERSLAG